MENKCSPSNGSLKVKGTHWVDDSTRHHPMIHGEGSNRLGGLDVPTMHSPQRLIQVIKIIPRLSQLLMMEAIGHYKACST